MIRLGLIERSIRETWLMTFALTAVIGAVSGLLSRALPAVQERFMQRSFIPPQVQQFRNAILGVESSLSSSVSEIAYALAWSHPVLLLPLLAHAIIYTTRVPAGELERGTMDVLLGLPISRLGLLISESLAWILSASVLFAAIMLGSWIGTRWLKPDLHPDWPRMAIVLANLAAVYAVIGAMAAAASACSDKRGRAVLVVMVITLASLVINFLALLWEPMGRLGFLSLLHYYRPALILRSGDWPWADLGILLGIAAGLWILAAAVLSRRDLATT